MLLKYRYKNIGILYLHLYYDYIVLKRNEMLQYFLFSPFIVVFAVYLCCVVLSNIYFDITSYL